MSYIDRHLMEGERVVFRTRLHWKVLVVPLLADVVLLALAVLAMRTTRPWLSVIPVIAGALWTAAALTRRSSSEFAVTNRRIVLKLGVLTTRSVEMLHSKIESVAVNQTLAGKFFGYGSIVVTGSGGTREVFDAIQAPLEFRNAVSSSASGEAGQG
jgi:uncharacterized membrane protein YdbT with pleckstrin-like domain